MTHNDVRAALASRPRPCPSLAMVNQVLAAAPSRTAIEKRNRALVAFTIITAARVDAIRTFKLRDVELSPGRVYHDPRHVNSKRRKSFTTDFVPIGGEAEVIFRGWIEFLTHELGFGPDDPLFPRPVMAQDENRQLCAVGLAQAHWETTQPIRNIFREAFAAAGLPYFHPHSFRHTLVTWAKHRRMSQAEWEAFSQNIGHSHSRTTSESYGKLSEEEKSAIIRNMSAAGGDPEDLKSRIKELAALL